MNNDDVEVIKVQCPFCEQCNSLIGLSDEHIFCLTCKTGEEKPTYGKKYATDYIMGELIQKQIERS